MQSARPGVLAVLDRRHTPDGSPQVVRWAREAGFGSVSVDLIYGSPTETARRLAAPASTRRSASNPTTSRLLADRRARHPARRPIGRGELPAPDEDAQADCYDLAEERLVAAGLRCTR